MVSVHLARRILHLERANGSLHKDLEREKATLKQLADEVLNCFYLFPFIADSFLLQVLSFQEKVFILQIFYCIYNNNINNDNFYSAVT